jgi:Ca-activated chloride channel family protein
MTFAWPLALFGLLLVPFAVAAYLAAQQRRARYAVRFTNLDLLANVVEGTPAWRRHVPATLYILGIAALLFALSRPQTSQAVPKEEATVILVTDVSGSMNATDVEPTRLAAAQEAAKALVDGLPKGFQIGLVAFNNTARLLVIPTTDKDTIDAALDTLRPNGGTALGDAIVAALDAARPVLDDGFPAPAAGAAPTPTPTPRPASATDKPVIVILLSDGANTTGATKPLEAAQLAADADVPVFTIALGTQAGIASVTDNLGRTRQVRVPPDEATLQQIADLTQAKFFSAPSAEDLQSIYDELGSKIGYDQQDREITFIFAAAAALFVVAAGSFSLFWFNRFP